jgi:hypothetical protein
MRHLSPPPRCAVREGSTSELLFLEATEGPLLAPVARLISAAATLFPTMKLCVKQALQ